MLGAIAIAAQRLLPAIQAGYAAWAAFKGSHHSLRDVLELLDQKIDTAMTLPNIKKMNFSKSIRLESIRFQYYEGGPWVLDDINLNILKGSKVGIMGITGSGKSTLLDVLMGLLAPTEGRILVDGKIVDSKSVRSWQKNIAHVPQTIFLADNTVKANIAFGESESDMDLERVKMAAEEAQASEFVEAQPNTYEATVGEDGVQLSGGQRQRIGLARAIYKSSEVLILDEATSALDSKTENLVMNSIERLHPDMTILMIAHRITTLKNCDQIIELQAGRVAAKRTYKELINESKR